MSPEESQTPQSVSRVWGNWGEYMLVPEWREWALDQLGVGESVLTVDLFATPWTTAAPYFISEEMDAFSFDWGALLLSEVQMLWANPPFAILGKVIAKLEEDA